MTSAFLSLLIVPSSSIKSSSSPQPGYFAGAACNPAESRRDKAVGIPRRLATRSSLVGGRFGNKRRTAAGNTSRHTADEARGIIVPGCGCSRGAEILARSSQPKHRIPPKGQQRRALGDHLRRSQGLEARCVVAKERGEDFVRVLTRRRDRTYATRRGGHLDRQARNVDLACECVRLLG